MEEDGREAGAFAETVVFLIYFNDLPDPRQRGKVRYPLPEVLLLCLLAVLAGAETATAIARFGEKKLDLLRRFRPFDAGTPAHDHLGDILATRDAEAFQRCFVAWVAAMMEVPEGVVAIDGKTVRRSNGAAKDAIHMVPVGPSGGEVIATRDVVIPAGTQLHVEDTLHAGGRRHTAGQGEGNSAFEVPFHRVRLET